MAAIGIAGAISVVWLHRTITAPRPAPPAPTALSELGLPAQVEIAFTQNDLDAAATATKALIDQGKYSEAISALETADRRQQEDAIVSFFKGRAQWGLTKQGSTDYTAADAMRSWTAALESESDWMEIAMALGFAQYAVGREQLALETWQRAIDLAERQPEQFIYFSEKTAGEYALNAQAGVAIAALALSKIEADPTQRNQLLAIASDAYRTAIDEAPTDFNAKALGSNWLWLGGAIADWESTKEELSQTIE